MSDEEEEYDNSEEDENSDEDGSEEDDSDDEKDKDEDDEKIKLIKVKNDITKLTDIFSYIDKTSKRMSQQLLRESQIRHMEKEREVEKLKEKQRLRDLEKEAKERENGTDYDDDDDGNDGIDEELSLHWSQYENLEEEDRAELLERAIMVLGGDEDKKKKEKKRNINNNIKRNDDFKSMKDSGKRHNLDIKGKERTRSKSPEHYYNK